MKMPLVFCVALPSEATPLLERWKFARVVESPFPIYYSKDLHSLLVVSGVGKQQAGAAVAYLGGKINDNAFAEYGVEASQTSKTRSCLAGWINFGSCGHAKHKLGSGFLIHKIRDAESGEVHYPFRLPYAQSAEISCHAKPQKSYKEGAKDVLVDMESSAFFGAASKFADAELIQLYKVVADNSANPPVTPDNYAKFNAEVGKLLAKHVEDVAELCEKLRALAQDNYSARAKMEQQLAKWQLRFMAHRQTHWTVTQKHQLRDLLEQCYALQTDVDALLASLGTKRSNAREMIAKLKAELA